MSTLSAGRRIAFSLITLALVVATIELAMIVFEPLLFRGFYQYDPDLGFRVRPHAGGSNRFGFNDRDYPLHKPAGAYRVMVLGDSFNWAGGRRGNYATLLEQTLQARFGAEQVELINAGYPMTHTAEQLKLLRKFGMRLEPDLLVLAFFMGIGFYDADPQRKRIVVNDT